MASQKKSPEDEKRRKNEKVDYVIVRDGNLSILIECKCITIHLSINHASQLFRYFAKQVYDGALTQKRRAPFTTLVGQAFRDWVNNRISERLQNSLESVNPPVKEENEVASDSADVHVQPDDGM